LLTGGGRGISRGLVAGLIPDFELLAAEVAVEAVEVDAGTVVAGIASGAESRLVGTVTIEDADNGAGDAEIVGAAGTTPRARTVTAPARSVVGTADTVARLALLGAIAIAKTPA